MVNNFQKLGLSYYESRALEAALNESLTVRNLSKKARIPLGKVYSIINSLENKQILKQTETRPKLIYIEDASSVISKLIEQKKRQDEELITKMRELAVESDIVKSKPSKFFQIGTTIEENKEIQLRTFIEAKKEVLQIINIHHKPKSNREAKTMWEKEIAKAVEKGVVFKAIYPKEVEIPKILQNLTKQDPAHFKIKRLDTDFTRCDIIDGRKVLVKLVHEDPLHFGGIVFIENEKFAENLTKIFDEMWEHAE